MKIKELDKDNISEALELVWHVFQKFEAPEYSNEGIIEFKNFISYDHIINAIDKGNMRFWGCFDNKYLVGVIAIRPTNHISLLFVNEKYHRQGIAKNLFNEVKNECIKEGNNSKITVNSSPYGKDFYHSVGFIDANKEQVVNGIKFTPMIFNLREEE